MSTTFGYIHIEGKYRTDNDVSNKDTLTKAFNINKTNSRGAAKLFNKTFCCIDKDCNINCLTKNL